MKRFLGSSMWLFAGIMLGRILGLVRDLVIANQLGQGVDADRAIFVVTIPDVMVNILIGGAMGAALIPEFKRRGPGDNWALFRQSGWAVFGVMAAATAALAVFAGPITRMLVSGLPEEAVPGTARLVQICLWAVPFTAASAVVRAKLQSHERFAVPSFAGFVYNLAIVLGLVAAGFFADLRWLAVSAVGGAVLSLGMQVADSWRFRETGGAKPGLQIDHRLTGRYIGALLAGSAVLVLPVAMRAFASTNGPGGQAVVYYASKLVDLPMGTVLTIVSIAMFPAIADAFAKTESHPEGVRLAQNGLRAVLALALPVALGMGVFSLAFSNLLYRHGEMGSDGARQVGALAAVMMVGLVPQALNSMLLVVFDALRDMVTPFILSLVAILAFLAAGFLGVRGLMPLAWLYAGFHWCLMVALAAGLAIRHKLRLFEPGFAAKAFAGIAGSGVAFGIFCLAAYRVATDSPPAVGVCLAILGGFASLAGGLAADPETRRSFSGAVLRKLRKAA